MAKWGAQLKPGQSSMIEAIIDDGSYHLLSPQALDVLLEHNLVLKFKRSCGWVTVGVDPIRVSNKIESLCSFPGPEKRFAGLG